MMRSVLSFIGGAVAVAILFCAFPRAGRYQIVRGKTPGTGVLVSENKEFNEMETMFRIDTATGRTWQLLTTQHVASYWWEIGSEGPDDPLFPKSHK